MRDSILPCPAPDASKIVRVYSSIGRLVFMVREWSPDEKRKRDHKMEPRSEHAPFSGHETMTVLNRLYKCWSQYVSFSGLCVILRRCIFTDQQCWHLNCRLKALSQNECSLQSTEINLSIIWVSDTWVSEYFCWVCLSKLPLWAIWCWWTGWKCSSPTFERASRLLPTTF